MDADERLQSFFAYAVVVVGDHCQSSLEFPVLGLGYDKQVTDGLHLVLPSEARDKFEAAHHRTVTSSMLKECNLKVNGSNVCSEIGAAQRMVCNSFADSDTAHTVFLCVDDIAARAKCICEISVLRHWISGLLHRQVSLTSTAILIKRL